MKSRLVREVSCVHGYFQDCTFKTDSGEDCPGGSSREVTVDEIWDRYYEIADRRNKAGLNLDDLRRVVFGL